MCNKIIDLYQKVDERINNGEKLTHTGKNLITENIAKVLADYKTLESEVKGIFNSQFANDSTARNAELLLENFELKATEELTKFIDVLFDIEKITFDTEEKIKQGPKAEEIYLDPNAPTSGVVDNGNNDLPPPPTEINQVV